MHYKHLVGYADKHKDNTSRLANTHMIVHLYHFHKYAYPLKAGATISKTTLSVMHHASELHASISFDTEFQWYENIYGEQRSDKSSEWDLQNDNAKWTA